MEAKHHTSISLVLSGALYSISESWELAIASFISGIIIDMDHCIDYIREYGLYFDIDMFFKSYSEYQYKRMFLFLHGWEWLFFWAMIAWLTGWNMWILGLLAGHSHHMILDQIFNKPSRWGYSLLWRWKYNFEFSRFFPPEDLKP
jgi:hypothetical protein